MARFVPAAFSDATYGRGNRRLALIGGVGIVGVFVVAWAPGGILVAAGLLAALFLLSIAGATLGSFQRAMFLEPGVAAREVELDAEQRLARDRSDRTR